MRVNWTFPVYASLSWPCWLVASAVSQQSCLFGRWERKFQSECCPCCKISLESSHRTSTGSHGRARGGWSGSVQHALTSWSWFWDWPYCCTALAACCRPAFAAIRTTATWCHRAWSGVSQSLKDPWPGHIPMGTCCRCCPAVPCYSWAYCNIHLHNEACRVPDGLANF